MSVDPMAVLPEMLLNDRSIPLTAKLLYVTIQVYHPNSHADLSRLTGLSVAGVSRMCERLVKPGWIHKAREGRSVVPVPAIPPCMQEQMVTDLHKGFISAKLKGEYLTRKWLDRLIMSADYIDGARPVILMNPLTGEPLELDRYYPSLKVGFEHHGPQHCGPTKQFPDQEQFNRLRSRDLIKRGLCQENGIVLVELAADDLTLDALLKKMPKGVPLRQVDRNSPYVKALEALSAEYRAGLMRSMVRESNASRK